MTETPEAPEAQLFPVRLLRGYWPEDGEGKLPVGQEVDLPLVEAERIIRQGVAVRNDAMPSIAPVAPAQGAAALKRTKA